MRQIGQLDSDKDARTFGDFLYVQGIETDIERDNNRWAIWVRDDDHVPQAAKLLEEFRAEPNAPRFQAGSPAEKLREKAKAADAAYQKRVITGQNLFPGLRNYGFGVVTYALIGASILVAILSRLGAHEERISALFIEQIYSHGGELWAGKNFEAIRSGQVWRLVTPILIHFGIIHILFNMMWLRDLGSLFEARLGSWYFAVFVLVVAVCSNLAQYVVTKNPWFGGMSGVVYGLIGYAWIRGRFDPAAGVGLDRQTVVYALVWFALCFTGWIGPVANWAHGGGLAIGMLWAFVDARRK
jgi:GlpG protein